MRNTQLAVTSKLFITGVFAVGLSILVSGCGNQSGTETPPPASAVPPSNAATDKGMTNSMTPATATAPKGVALGTAQAAGPFQVTLSSDKAPAAGNATFHVAVTKNGQAVKNATVTLQLSMPSMNMPGPVVTLKPSGDKYTGVGELMASDYAATVTVKADGVTGTATYSFVIK